MTDQELKEIQERSKIYEVTRIWKDINICIAEIRRLQESDKRKDEIIAKMKDIVRRQWEKEWAGEWGVDGNSVSLKKEIDSIG